VATRRSITATSQTIDIIETGGQFSLESATGSDTMYFRRSANSSYAGSASELQAASDGELPLGQSVLLPAGFGQIDVVCATGETATLIITPGMVSSPITVEANLGNVGLLNKAETEVDPATEDKQDAANTLLGQIDADTGAIKASLSGSVDGPGSPTIDSYSSAVMDCGVDATTSVIATPGADKQL